MEPSEIKVGRTYAAKKPAAIQVDFAVRLINDRQVQWISADRGIVQYDGPAVANGRHFPKVSMEKFAAWAAEDVTEKMPEGEWRPAP